MALDSEALALGRQSLEGSKWPTGLSARALGLPVLCPPPPPQGDFQRILSIYLSELSIFQRIYLSLPEFPARVQNLGGTQR